MEYKITDEELKYLRVQFSLHDTNKTGSIEFASFRAILGDLGKHYSAEEAIAIGKKISYQADCVSFFQMLVHYKALKGNNEMPPFTRSTNGLTTSSSVPTQAKSSAPNALTKHVLSTTNSNGAHTSQPSHPNTTTNNSNLKSNAGPSTTPSFASSATSSASSVTNYARYCSGCGKLRATNNHKFCIGCGEAYRDIPPANSTSGAATPVQSASPALQPSPFIPEPCQQTPVTHPITHSHHHRTHLPSISARAPSITTIDSSPAEDVFPSPTITTTPSADQSPASLVKAPSGHSKSKTLTHESSSSPAAKKRSSKEHHRKSNSRENSVVSTSATGEVEKSLSRHSSGKRRKNSVASTPTATPSDSASVSIANSAEIPPPSDLPPVFDGVTSDGLVPPSDLPPVWATPRLEVEENRPVLSDADLAKMMMKRHHLVQELFETEKNYYQDLSVLWEFRRKVQETKVLTEEEYNFLFDATFEKIMLCSQLLIQELDDRVSNQPDYSLVVIGSLFLNMVDYVSSYSPFLNHFDERQLLVSKLRGCNQPFNQALRNMEKNGKGFDDASISVVQRVPRYVMLLTALIGATPPLHEDYKLLMQAEEVVKEATTILNEGKKQYDRKRMTVLIEGQLRLASEEGRFFEYEEMLFPVATKAEQQQCPTKFRFILCNQCAIVARLKVKDVDGPVRIIPLKKLIPFGFNLEDKSVSFPAAVVCDIIPAKAYVRSVSLFNALKAKFAEVYTLYETNFKDERIAESAKSEKKSAVVANIKFKTFLNFNKNMEHTIDELDRSDAVPMTQREVNALALFEELHSAEKERLKTQRKLAKNKNQPIQLIGKAGIGNDLERNPLSHSTPAPHAIALETKKELDAFALFEELQRAETERLRALRSGAAHLGDGGTRELHHLADEGVHLLEMPLTPVAPLVVVATNQKEREAMALLEGLQRAEQERKIHGNEGGAILYTVDAEKESSTTTGTSEGASGGGAVGDSVPKSRSQKKMKSALSPKGDRRALPSSSVPTQSHSTSSGALNSHGIVKSTPSDVASPTLGQERFWVYFDLEREQKNSVLRAKEISLQSHLENVCGLRGLVAHEMVVLTEDMQVIGNQDTAQREKIIHTLPFSGLYVFTKEFYENRKALIEQLEIERRANKNKT